MRKNLTHFPNNNKKTGVGIKDRRWRLRKYKQCFIGSDLVNWLILQEDLHIESREQAVAIGEILMYRGIIKHVVETEPFADDYFFYRFVEKDEAGSNPNSWEASWDELGGGSGGGGSGGSGGGGVDVVGSSEGDVPIPSSSNGSTNSGIATYGSSPEKKWEPPKLKHKKSWSQLFRSKSKSLYVSLSFLFFLF